MTAISGTLNGAPIGPLLANPDQPFVFTDLSNGNFWDNDSLQHHSEGRTTTDDLLKSGVSVVMGPKTAIFEDSHSRPPETVPIGRCSEIMFLQSTNSIDMPSSRATRSG